MLEMQEIIDDLSEINDKLMKMYKIEGNLEGLRFFEQAMELLLENYSTFTKGDLEKILRKVRQTKREKLDKLEELSSK